MPVLLQCQLTCRCLPIASRFILVSLGHAGLDELQVSHRVLTEIKCESTLSRYTLLPFHLSTFVHSCYVPLVAVDGKGLVCTNRNRNTDTLFTKRCLTTKMLMKHMPTFCNSPVPSISAKTVSFYLVVLSSTGPLRHFCSAACFCLLLRLQCWSTCRQERVCSVSCSSYNISVQSIPRRQLPCYRCSWRQPEWYTKRLTFACVGIR